MHREYRLSIITVNYNGMHDTCALLDHIAFNPADTEVIVVDNGSSVNEAEMISTRYPEVTCIRSDKNLGFAGGNNLGIRNASGKYLFFINNDTEVAMGDIDKLIERMDSSKRIGIVCPKIRFYYGERHIQYAGFTPMSRITCRNRGIGYDEDDRGQHDRPYATAFAHGAAMLTTRDRIEHVGCMPECYFLYYEEMDWSEMFKRTGYEIWYEPTAVVWHKESRSTGSDSALKTYWLTRNRLLFVRRNFGASRILTYSYLIVGVALRDILRSVLHRRCDLAKATIKGIVDFIKI